MLDEVKNMPLLGTSYPLDSGPLYSETDMARLPVEPWNTFSNLVFLFVVIHWALRVYPQYRRHWFLALALPILFIGFIGGTLYHAFRDEEVWLLMDWLPIVILCLACTILFARRAGLSWLRLLPLLALPFMLRWLMINVMGWTSAVVLNVEYALIAGVVLAPLVLHLHTRQWRRARWVLASVGCFALALIFRILDAFGSAEWMPMGSHWLWHFFGGLAVHFLMSYIHHDDLHLLPERQRA